MKIRSILISNYKSLDAFLVFSEGINVITGHNGSGKSNILEAIKFVLNSDSNFDSKLIPKGKSMAAIKLTLTDRKILLDDYSILKKIYKSGKIKTYQNDDVPDLSLDCILLDYDSHCFMNQEKLDEFKKQLIDKSKTHQIIIVSMSKEIIEIADSVFKMQGTAEKCVLAKHTDRASA